VDSSRLTFDQKPHHVDINQPHFFHFKLNPTHARRDLRFELCKTIDIQLTDQLESEPVGARNFFNLISQREADRATNGPTKIFPFKLAFSRAGISNLWQLLSKC
jgi:hypothetical protein